MKELIANWKPFCLVQCVSTRMSLQGQVAMVGKSQGKTKIFQGQEKSLGIFHQVSHNLNSTSIKSVKSQGILFLHLSFSFIKNFFIIFR